LEVGTKLLLILANAVGEIGCTADAFVGALFMFRLIYMLVPCWSAESAAGVQHWRAPYALRNRSGKRADIAGSAVDRLLDEGVDELVDS
jgi:hypothetical protein